jgi:hypothetical protein
VLADVLAAGVFEPFGDSAGFFAESEESPLLPLAAAALADLLSVR